MIFFHILQLLEGRFLLLHSLQLDLLGLQLGEEVVAGRVEGGIGQQVLLALKLLEQKRVELLEN